jgi:hypothetical protein
MTDHDKSQDPRRNDIGKTLGVSQRLLAAVSLLGVSLGVSAAAPAPQIAAADDTVAGDVFVKVAENKLNSPGAISIMGGDVRTQKLDASPQGKFQSDQSKEFHFVDQYKFQSDQLKQKGNTKTIHIDQFQSGQLKQKADTKTIHIERYKFQSDQKK